MVQERSRAAAAARALAWALALAAAWLLLALVAPADRAAAEPLARDLGSLVGDTVDGALDAADQVDPTGAVGSVVSVAETVIEPAPVIDAATAPVAPASVAPAPVAPAPAPAPLPSAPAAAPPAAAPSPDATSPAESPLAPPPTSELLRPVGEPLSSILAPVVGLATPIIDPALGVVDEVAGPILDGVLDPVIGTIDDVLVPSTPGVVLPLIPPVAEPGSVVPDAPRAILMSPLVDSPGARSPRASELIATPGDASAVDSVVGDTAGVVDGPRGASPFGGGVMPPASASLSSVASGTGVLGVVGFLLPLALLRGSLRLGVDVDVPTGPAREHAPSPD